MSVSLNNILNKTDLELIPDNVRNTIDCVLESKCKSLDLEKEHVSFCEKNYNELKIKVDYQSELVNRYKSHITQLEDDLHKARRELCDSNHEKDCLNVEIKNLNLELNSREDHLTRLNELIKSKNEETISLIETNRKIQIDLDQLRKDTNSNELNEHHFSNLLDEKEKLFGLECNYLKEELSRITIEYHEKCTKLNALNSEMVNFKNETEVKVNDLKKESNSIRNQNTFLNSLVEKKDNQINELAMKLNELHQHQELLKEQYNIEKKEHSELINYYKKLLEDSKSQKVELIDKIKELHASFTESNENQRLALDKLREQNLSHTEEIKFKDKLNLQLQHKVEELDFKLINMNQKEVDTAIKQFFPTSSTVSKVMEKNMPLTAVYTKYEECSERCQELLIENDELKLQIHEMIAESEKNAPLLFYKTQENKKSLVEIEDYKLQLSRVSSDLENALSEIENYNKINNYLKRELKRYEKSNIDLSRQVQCLIQTVHEKKGNFVSTKFLINDDYLDKESSFDKSISINLVTFKNIEEIHDNNQKLLATIRELSEQYQELQDKYHNGEDQTSKRHIDELLVQIENLKEENRHKQEILSEMMSEWESKLSNKHDMKEIKQGTTLFKITSRAYLEEKIAELSNSLEKKIDEFEMFKNQTKEQEEQLRSLIKDHLEQISNYQNEIAKLSVKLESLNENNKILDTTLTRYNKDMNLMKERNIKLEEQRKTLKDHIHTFELKKNELLSKLEEMNKELDAKVKLLNLLERENDHLKLESGMIKSRVDELKAELTDNKKELSQVKSEYQIGTVKNELNLKHQIELLDLKNNDLQKSVTILANEKKELNEKLVEKEKQFKEISADLKRRIVALTHEKAMIVKDNDRISKQLKESQDKLIEIEQSTDDNAAKKNQMKKILELQRQLEERRIEINRLTNEKSELIKRLKQKEFQYENALRVNRQQIDEFEAKLEAKIAPVKKQLEENILREKILKSKYESRIQAQEKEFNETREKLAMLEQQQSINKNEQQQQQQNQQSSLIIKQQQQEQQQQQQQQQQKQQHLPTITITTTPITSKTTASIRPLTVVNRPKITITPQTMITNLQTASTTSSPQMAYVTPTHVEISNADNISSSSSTVQSTSFSTPSTSSNILSSNQDQFAAASNLLKRSRMISLEESNPKKQKVNLFTITAPKTSASSEQQIDSNLTISSRNEQIEQATSSSSLIDQDIIIPTSQQLQHTTTSDLNQQQIAEREEEKERPTQTSDNQELSRNVIEDNRIVQEADGNSLNMESNIESNLDTESQDQQERPEQEQEQFQQPSNIQAINSLMIVEQSGEINQDEEMNSDDELNDNNNEMNDEEADEENVEDEESEEYVSEEDEYEDEDEQNNDQENAENNENSQDNNSDVICLSDEDEENEQDLKNYELNRQTDSKSANEESNLNLNENYDEDNEAARHLNLMLVTTNPSDENTTSNQNYPDSATTTTFKDEFQLDKQATSSEQNRLDLPKACITSITSLGKAMPFTVVNDPNFNLSFLTNEQQNQLDLDQQHNLIVDLNVVETTSLPLSNTTTSVELSNAEEQQESNIIKTASSSNLSIQQESSNIIQNQLIDQTQASTSGGKPNQTKRLRRPVILKQTENQPTSKFSILDPIKKSNNNENKSNEN